MKGSFCEDNEGYQYQIISDAMVVRNKKGVDDIKVVIRKLNSNEVFIKYVDHIKSVYKK